MENTANIMERAQKNKDLDPLQILFDHASRYALPVKIILGFMRAIERHQKIKIRVNDRLVNTYRKYV
ncbi:hypothetical protein BSPWISOXPB_6862 [uncultured Gammaproteobacteria bacterium]|nr:hypothetical protein BSPWISOXPB_6862 [uncultured Gammaproteobacteria bacterium]